MVVLSELRKEASEFRELVRARHCGASSREGELSRKRAAEMCMGSLESLLNTNTCFCGVKLHKIGERKQPGNRQLISSKSSHGAGNHLTYLQLILIESLEHTVVTPEKSHFSNEAKLTLELKSLSNKA